MSLTHQALASSYQSLSSQVLASPGFGNEGVTFLAKAKWTGIAYLRSPRR